MAIEEGAKVSGKISGITNFGAFVDLDDNQTGLVHISQISDRFIKDIHDVLSGSRWTKPCLPTRASVDAR